MANRICIGAFRRPRRNGAPPAKVVAARMLLTRILLIAALLVSCAPRLKPSASPDPEVGCPGGRLTWKLEIEDRRADRKDTEHIQALLRDSLSRSFPACRWVGPSDPDAGAFTIEIHRFGVVADSGVAGVLGWEAIAEWTVSARDRSGRTLTQFESVAEVSRPNYRGSNNEREALQQAFDQAFSRTLAGLRAVFTTG